MQDYIYDGKHCLRVQTERYDSGRCGLRINGERVAVGEEAEIITRLKALPRKDKIPQAWADALKNQSVRLVPRFTQGPGWHRLSPQLGYENGPQSHYGPFDRPHDDAHDWYYITPETASRFRELFAAVG